MQLGWTVCHGCRLAWCVHPSPVFTAFGCSLCPVFAMSGLLVVHGLFAACSQGSGCRARPKGSCFRCSLCPDLSGASP
eukprot:15438719-Alexandrium_andersonii.AAC.1